MIETEGWEGIGEGYRLPLPYERLAVIALEIKDISDRRTNLLAKYQKLFSAVDEEMIAFSKESIGSRKILHISEEHAWKIADKHMCGIIKDAMENLE